MVFSWSDLWCLVMLAAPPGVRKFHKNQFFKEQASSTEDVESSIDQTMPAQRNPARWGCASVLSAHAQAGLHPLSQTDGCDAPPVLGQVRHPFLALTRDP